MLLMETSCEQKEAVITRMMAQYGPPLSFLNYGTMGGSISFAGGNHEHRHAGAPFGSAGFFV